MQGAVDTFDKGAFFIIAYLDSVESMCISEI